MRRYTLHTLLFCILAAFGLQAQHSCSDVGFGFRLSHDYAFYRHYQQPEANTIRQTPRAERTVKQVMDVIPSIDAGFFLTSKAGLFSLSTGVAYAPFSTGKYNPSGRGALTIPTLLRYSRYGGVLGKGIGFTAGLGVQFTKTEFLKLKGSEFAPADKPFFRTYVGEIELDFVLGGTYMQRGITQIGLFTRAGWCPELDAVSIETGMRYTINVPFTDKAEDLLYEPISLRLPGDAWPMIGY